MSDTCANCKFWSHWHFVMLADDEPKALGHCVVRKPTDTEFVEIVVAFQGLTAEDFFCSHYERAEVSDV